MVLGKTGRNLAAGMSGGRAFVLDLDLTKLNGEMVDVIPIDSLQSELLRNLISRHAAETGSLVAAEILAAWPDSFSRFSLIMPREFARVLTAISMAESEGRSVDDAVMEVANG